MKLLIVAGGGGHFSPALAVIEQLPKEWDVMVVGRKYAFEGDKTLSLEYQTAKKLGITFTSLTTGRLQRRFTRHTLQSLVKIPVGFTQAIQILQNYQPDVVLSFGGYVSVPVVLASALLRIPIVVHEQILGAGLANNIAAKFAQKICISWEQSRQFFSQDKVVLTGNPIRVIASKAKQSQDNGIAKLLSVVRNDEKKIIYITGGSGGAHAINVLIEECLEKLLQKYTLVHQTGDAKEFGDFDRLAKQKEALPIDLQKRYMLTKFVDPAEVFSVLEKADLVIARSGINTVTELLAFGKPCLLIPLPYGQHNEQLTNALFVKQLGLGEVAQQQTLTGEKLAVLLDTMMHNLEKYTKQSSHAKKLLQVDAAQKIISVIADVQKEKKR